MVKLPGTSFSHRTRTSVNANSRATEIAKANGISLSDLFDEALKDALLKRGIDPATGDPLHPATSGDLAAGSMILASGAHLKDIEFDGRVFRGLALVSESWVEVLFNEAGELISPLELDQKLFSFARRRP